MFLFRPSLVWKRTSSRSVYLWEKFEPGRADCIRSGSTGRSVRTVCRRASRNRISDIDRRGRLDFAEERRTPHSGRRCAFPACSWGAVRRYFLFWERRICRILFSFLCLCYQNPGIRVADIWDRTKSASSKPPHSPPLAGWAQAFLCRFLLTSRTATLRRESSSNGLASEGAMNCVSYIGVLPFRHTEKSRR